jgi:uncharacterized protein YbaR (Trm112 family)/SAM-dependent methyltransferase
MLAGTLEILRCPYCGGQLTLVESLFHRRDGDEIHDGILGCQCCIFPVVDGVPVLHLQSAATTAREQVEAGRPDLARRTMFGLDDEAQAEIFDQAASSPTATYRETVNALGPGFEGGYFLYRFSDPTFVVADAVVRALGQAALGGRRRAVDICGGSGHLTRSLLDFSSPAPVLADLYYAKVWLARRFTAPGCEPVCCDGNAPMPFARGAFGLAMCTDAFMYIWTKRQFVGEMERLVAGDGVVLIGHTHNERTWSPSHGQPLSPEGYAALFETMEPRLFGEGGLFTDVVERGVLDLSRRDSPETLNADPALTIVATPRGRETPGLFARHDVAASTPAASGEFRINPLYRVEPADADARTLSLRLRFPDVDYEQEYGACRRYLPDEVRVDRASIEALPSAIAPPALADLVQRRVVLKLPRLYY